NHNRPSVISFIVRGERDRTGGAARSGEGAEADVRPGLRIADRQIGVCPVLEPAIKPVDRRPEVRKPQVVVGRVDAPGGRELDLPGGIAEHAIAEEAVAEVLPHELHGAERTGLTEGHVAGRAWGVVGLPLEVVAALEVVPGAGADRPADLVGRMAANLGASQSASPRAEEASRQARAWGNGAEQRDSGSSILAAADAIRRNHEQATAP